MSDVSEAHKIASSKAILSMGKYWLMVSELTENQNNALLNEGWTPESLMNDWLIAPDDWKP